MFHFYISALSLCFLILTHTKLHTGHYKMGSTEVVGRAEMCYINDLFAFVQ